MVKGITLVREVQAAADFADATNFLAALGLEPGKGWTNEQSQGSPLLSPLGNLELVRGKLPATPEILVEVTSLDAVHAVAQEWVKKNAASSRFTIGPVLETHWNSRIFIVEPVPGLVLGFWESNDPLHGRPIAIEGDLSAAGMRFGIVVARWNAVITDRLLQGALDALLRSGANQSDLRIVRVPGAWEIPAAARLLAESGGVDAVVALGVLLRGETAHYEAIYNEVTRGIGQSQQETGVPHTFGVLTCETLEQALDRAGLKMGNKGFEAAISAVEMVSVKRKVAASAAEIATGR